MYLPPKEIMIEKGSRIECKRTINLGGKEGVIFTANEMYNSPENNCLIDNNGNPKFIQQDYLPCFYV